MNHVGVKGDVNDIIYCLCCLFTQDIFMNCKRTCEDLHHTLKLKQDEFERLRDEGESDTLKKPNTGAAEEE